MVYGAADWGGGLKAFEEFPEPEDFVFDLGDGNRIEVYAIAVAQPGEDKHTPWLDPKSFEEIPNQQLLEALTGERVNDSNLERIQQEASSFNPFTPYSSNESPILTLLLRSSGGPGFTAHVASAHAFDARTHAEVSYVGTHFPHFRESTEDEWTRLGVSLGIWHDTPVDLGIVWFCGQPKVAEFREKKDGYWQAELHSKKASVIDPHRNKEIVTGEASDGNEMVPTIEIGSMTHYMQPGAWLSQLKLEETDNPKSWALQALKTATLPGF